MTRIAIKGKHDKSVCIIGGVIPCCQDFLARLNKVEFKTMALRLME